MLQHTRKVGSSGGIGVIGVKIQTAKRGVGRWHSPSELVGDVGDVGGGGENADRQGLGVSLAVSM